MTVFVTNVSKIRHAKCHFLYTIKILGKLNLPQKVKIQYLFTENILKVVFHTFPRTLTHKKSQIEKTN